MRRSYILAGALCAAMLLHGATMAFLIFDSRVAQPGRLPDGWRVRVNRGSPEVGVIQDSQGSVLHLSSHRSSYGLERGLDIDPAQYPYLTWKWKVTSLPKGADFRHMSTDDQAAQVLVAFGDRHILEYIWDSSAPKGTAESASGIPFVHIFAFVCRSGGGDLNQWLSETRNVAADYARAFGRPPSQRVKGIRIQINSQHTGTSAESYFSDLGFRSTP